MRTYVASFSTGNMHITRGGRTKVDTPRGKYVTVMTELVCDIPTILIQETVLPGLMWTLMGEKYSTML